MDVSVDDNGEVEQTFDNASTANPLIFNDLPVHVRNALKSFPQRNAENIVLNNLNLTVSRGQIYGLLGPSGCGKTTLLKCIIGRLSLDSGQILTFGERPGTPESAIPGPRLGYMPQEDALDGILSINEILYYYGCLLCVPKKRILTKITFLVDFLKLPSEKIYFSTLSGGQKRRVSFAVALIGDAELLLLDEPTVGVDPVLKHNIWSYLHELVEGGKKTVIITTHYIEEARLATCVGMMFEGRFLAEGSPNHLMSIYCKKSLEDVFHFVHSNEKKTADRRKRNELGEEEEEDCNFAAGVASVPLLRTVGLIVKDSTTTGGTISRCNNLLHCETPIRPVVHIRNTARYNQCVSWSRLQAILYRAFIQFFRYPGLIVMIMALPLVSVFVCGISIGKPLTSIQMGVVNEDSGRFANRFLSHIDSTVIIMNNFTSWEDARQSVIDGKTWGALKFGKNFSSTVIDRYNSSLKIAQSMIMDSKINVTLDGTNFFYAETIRTYLLDVFKKFISNLLTEYNIDPDLANIPIVMDKPVFGNAGDSYQFFLLPAFILGCAFFLPLGCAVIIISVDKDGGKLERVYTTGVTLFEITSGYLIIQLVVISAQLVIIFVTAFVILQYRNEGSSLLFIALYILQGICGTVLGMLIAVSVDKFITGAIISVAIISLAQAISGYFWPLEAAEIMVRNICMISPLTLPVNALRNIMYRSFDLQHPEVVAGFGIPLACTLLFVALTAIVLRAKKST